MYCRYRSGQQVALVAGCVELVSGGAGFSHERLLRDAVQYELRTQPLTPLAALLVHRFLLQHVRHSAAAGMLWSCWGLTNILPFACIQNDL